MNFYLCFWTVGGKQNAWRKPGGDTGRSPSNQNRKKRGYPLYVPLVLFVMYMTNEYT